MSAPAPHEIWAALSPGKRVAMLRFTFHTQPTDVEDTLDDWTELEDEGLLRYGRETNYQPTTLGRAVAKHGRTAHWELCERCGRQLEPGKEVMLELNSATGDYAEGLEPGDAGPHGDRTVHGKDSQGGFYFGAACARIVLRTAGWHEGMTATAEHKNRRGRSA